MGLELLKLQSPPLNHLIPTTMPNMPAMPNVPIPDTLTNALTYVGAATTCLFGFQLARHIYCYTRPSSLPRYNPPGKDAWALVTGATDGIGFGFAQSLCRRGFNVFLHGRNREKLLKRQQDLQNEFPSVKTKIIVYDATNISEDIENIAQEVGDAHLTVLINNVGGSIIQLKQFPEMSYAEARDTITLNASFMTQVTRVLTPILEKNGPSLVVNISSAAAYGMQNISIYSGTKGYVESISRALEAEMGVYGRGIEVLGIRVGSVQSQGNDIAASWFNPSSRSMAEAALNRVGCGRPVVWGYWPHALQGISFDVIPRSILIRVISSSMQALQRQWAEREIKQK